MVIVAGHVTVEPKQRDSYLAGCVSIVEQARAAAGCLDVAIAADLIEPGRVNLFERWESQAAVEAFRSSGSSNEQLPAMLSVSVAEYDIADVRPLFGEGTALTSRTDRATTDQTAAARPSERRQDQQAGSRPRSA